MNALETREEDMLLSVLGGPKSWKPNLRDDVAVVITQGTSSGLKRLPTALDKRCMPFRTTYFVRVKYPADPRKDMNICFSQELDT